ncbi:MAG: SH3 domain-containing protein [Deltaproteobacteria bacterium]|nr:SH3 domain-containing protein [Deltaproteobacteria bacterium]
MSWSRTYLLAVMLVGCGGTTSTMGASNASSSPVDGADPVTTEASDDEAPSEASTDEPSWIATCDYGVARSDAPTGAVLVADGMVTVRADSITIDDPNAEQLTVCRATRALATGARLVLVVGEWELATGTWNGTAFTPGWGEAESASSAPPIPDVVLPGQEVTAARYMTYCPTDPSHPCMALGSYAALSAMSSSDPNGPRSGWDFTETALTRAPMTSRGALLTDDACGLRVRVRVPAEAGSTCSETTLEARLACLSAERVSAWDLMDAEAERDADAAAAAVSARGRAQNAATLALTDGTREIEVPAYGTGQIVCADGVALVLETPAEFGSTRGFVAISLTRGRITSAHRLSISDHEEGSSDCANAWDGVYLVPIVQRGRLVGGVVRGAGGAPRFDVGRGDVGELPPSDDEDEPPVAYRLAGEALAAIDLEAARAEVCPLRVADDDGETNVRPDPSTRRAPIGTLRNGTVLAPVEQRGRWYRIEQPLSGWVWSEGLARRCP